MVTRVYKHIIFLFTLTSMVFLVACVDDTGISTSIELEEENKVTIEIFTRAQDYQLPQTRAGWGAQEGNTAIEKTPYVLVFKGDGADATCIEIAQAFEDSGTAKRYVLLTKQPTTETFRILILANNESHFYFEGERLEWTIENLNENLKNKGLRYISDNLLTDKLSHPAQTTPPFTSSDWKKLIPMSYLTDPMNGIDRNTALGTTDNKLELIRGIAKIVFHNESGIQYTNDHPQKPYHRFVMKGVVEVGNTPRQSKVYNYSGQQLDNVELTKIAGNNQIAEDDPEIMYVMMSDNNYGQINWASLCYLNETPANNNETTYFIVKGDLTTYYEDGTEVTRLSYYKMAAIDKKELKPIEFKRNTEYMFKIRNIRAPGYASAEEAIAAPADNAALDYEVTIVDLSSHHTITNGYYYLGISNSKYILYTDESSSNPSWHHAFSIVTDYFSSSGQQLWKANQITTSDGIVCDISTISESGNAVSPLTIDVNVKFESKDTGWVEIWLGNLILIVEVERQGVIPVTGEWFKYCRYYKNPSEINQGTGKPVQYWDYGYYLIRGTVDSGANAWIKLAPGSNNPPVAAENYTSGGGQYFDPDKAPLTNVTDMVTSGHGKIQVYISSNEGNPDSRTGIFYLSTGINPYYASQSKVERIKFDIKQSGESN